MIGDLPDCPPWLLELAGVAKPVEAATQEKIPGVVPAHLRSNGPIPIGQRNNTLTRFAGRMRSVGMDGPEIADALDIVNQGECEQPLDRREIDSIARSVSRYAKRGTQGHPVEQNPLFWLPFNNKAFLASRAVTLMKDYQIGWTICLMCECWADAGTLPNDVEVLHRLARASCPLDEFERELQPVLEPYVQSDSDPGRLVHRDLRLLWEKQNANYEAKQRASMLAVESRRKKAAENAGRQEEDAA